MPVSFQNNGLIDLTAVKTFGISVKDGDNPIGYFGTGLKYAIAIILRTGGTVHLYRGEDKHVFSVRLTMVRGKSFSLVTLDGDDLGFTTEVGKNWKMWMAFREIYSNMKDEDGFAAPEKLKPTPETTTIIIDRCPAFLTCFEQRDKYFLEGEPFFRGKYVDVHHGATQSLFYRGVKVGQLPYVSMYTYNITGHVHLTEDRTVKYDWEPERCVARSWAAHDDTSMMTEILLADGKTYEGTLDFNITGCDQPKFLQTIIDIRNSRHAFKINQTAVKLQVKHAPTEVDPDAIELSEQEEAMLEIAHCQIERLGYKNSRKYKLYVLADLGTGCLGQAVGGKIVLSHRVFTSGQRMLTGTLLEEYLHLEYGFQDCCYDFQNYLFDVISQCAGKLWKDDTSLTGDVPPRPVVDELPF